MGEHVVLRPSISEIDHLEVIWSEKADTVCHPEDMHLKRIYYLQQHLKDPASTSFR